MLVLKLSLGNCRFRDKADACIIVIDTVGGNVICDFYLKENAIYFVDQREGKNSKIWVIDPNSAPVSPYNYGYFGRNKENTRVKKPVAHLRCFDLSLRSM
jgi:hypothetical protein